MLTAKNGPITLSGNVYERNKELVGGNKNERQMIIPISSPIPEGWGHKYTIDSTGDPSLDYRVVCQPFCAGDVAVYAKSDMFGRMASARGNCNYGFSGYFKASIFDGERWRNFAIWNFVTEEQRRYPRSRDYQEVLANVIRLIEERRGAIAEYRKPLHKRGSVYMIP